MRLTSCKRGDVVELAGDPVSLWLVVAAPTVRGSETSLVVQLRGRDSSRRTVKGRDVVALWRRAGRRSS